MKIPPNILLIDKPSGITSFDVIRRLRKTLGKKKMGHAGTLDPLATGLLIVGIEKGTKLLESFMNYSKEYEAIIEFGKTSTTYDADGELQRFGGSFTVPTREKVSETLKSFIGDIEQIPPAFSAKHVNGERAYELARRGEAVQLTPRKVKVFSLEMLEWNWPFAKIRVRCGKGMYVRSLAHDLGSALSCGGYVKELRRTAVGEFRVENAQKLPP